MSATVSEKSELTKNPRAPSRLASGKLPNRGESLSKKSKIVSPRHKRASITLTALMTLMMLYCLVPLLWLLINASKTKDNLYNSFAFWFSGPFALFQNVQETMTHDDGIFVRWFLNTVMYVVVGAGGATILAALAGYGLAKYRFPGRRAVFAIILGALAIPSSVLAVPQFLLFSEIGITNTPWSVIIPSMVSAFGLYLVWAYADQAIPDELLEAARIDGASEIRIFFSISLRQLAPALITVLMFAVVATWNNYFLPLIMLSDSKWYPLTLGLNQWAAASSSIGGVPIPNLVITGSLLTVIPISAAFLYLQRYWQSGLTAGSVK